MGVKLSWNVAESEESGAGMVVVDEAREEGNIIDALLPPLLGP